MDGEVIGLIGVVVVQGGLLWYKIGKLEVLVDRLSMMINGRKADKQEDDSE